MRSGGSSLREVLIDGVKENLGVDANWRCGEGGRGVWCGGGRREDGLGEGGLVFFVVVIKRWGEGVCACCEGEDSGKGSTRTYDRWWRHCRVGELCLLWIRRDTSHSRYQTEGHDSCRSDVSTALS